MTFAIGGGTGKPVFNTLRELARDSERLSIAVSYIQLSGWELLRDVLPKSSRSHLRILCTDQMGISDPKAIRAIIATGAKVRAFKPTDRVFHPKVFVGHRDGAMDRYILGSANLSRSALLTSVEVDQHGTDADGTLTKWFDALFNDSTKSVDFDEARLKSLDAAFAARLRSRLAFQRASASLDRQVRADETNAAGTVGSIFAGLSPDPGVAPLNFDKAGNNVRRLGVILQLLEGTRLLHGKALSDLKLLGLAEDGQLNALARKAAATHTIEGLARTWMRWLKSATTADLQSASPSGQLEQARAAFRSFWTMRPDVREYFIAHSHNPSPRQKPVLQTIELLANAGRRVSELTLEDVTTLSTILKSTEELPPAAALAVHGYLANKGARGWGYPDRRLAVEAWNDV